MSKTESMLLLYDRCDDSIKPDPHDEHAAKIVEILGYLPLAIDQADAYLQRRVGFPLARFLEEYSERRVLIWSEVPTIRDYNESVSTTWEMSFRLLDEDERKRDEMGKFLIMLSFLDFRNISKEIFMVPRSLVSSMNVDTQEIPGWLKILLKADGRWDLTKLEDLLTDFRSLSLIELTATSQGSLRLSLHPLVSEWIKYRADLVTRRQCLFEATQIVNTCLEAKAGVAARSILSVEVEQQIFQHQSSCMQYIRELRQEDRSLTEIPPFAEHWALFEAAASPIQTAQKGAWQSDQSASRIHSIDPRMNESTRDAQNHGEENIRLQRARAILNWLSEDDSDSRLVDLTSRSEIRIPQWLFDQPEFVAWSRSEFHILWIYGPRELPKDE